jgi:hypothetical protein
MAWVSISIHSSIHGQSLLLPLSLLSLSLLSLLSLLSSSFPFPFLFADFLAPLKRKRLVISGVGVLSLRGGGAAICAVAERICAAMRPRG